MNPTCCQIPMKTTLSFIVIGRNKNISPSRNSMSYIIRDKRFIYVKWPKYLRIFKILKNAPIFWISLSGKIRKFL